MNSRNPAPLSSSAPPRLAVALPNRPNCIVESLSGRPFPAEPIADGISHHQLLVASLEPRQLFGEHRHALPVRARHAGDIGAPERALRPERLEDLTQIAVDVPERVGLTRIARST